MRFALLLGFSFLVSMARAAEPPAAPDPHYNAAGFFDIHVCNWPDQPIFLMGLFSTQRHDEVAEIRLLAPSGKEVGSFKLERYRRVPLPGGAEKRVFISLFDIPPEREEGWYTVRVQMKDGRMLEARDRVELRTLPIAQGLQPLPAAEDVALPRELRWEPVPGALYYQVFIKDVWDDGKLILSSKLLTEPRLPLPEGLLKAGGSYLWQIHARNLNDDPLWGDFNHGSLTREVQFSVAE